MRLRALRPALLASALLSASSPAQTLVWSQDGEAQDDRFGISVSGGADLDGDGFDDAVVGSWRHDGPAGIDAGKAYVYSPQSLAQLWIFDGEAAADECGYAVAVAGDVNGDGTADVIVGAPLHNAASGVDAGKAYVLSGPDGTLLLSVTGEAVGDRFGFSVSGAGDVNGDGRADVIVGADRWNAPGALDAGKAYVYALPAAATAPLLLYSWTGLAQQDNFGAAVAGAGDANGDGRSDLVVGAWRFDPPSGTNAGRVAVFSGLTGAPLFTFDGESPAAAFGAAVAGPGDTDGDGRADILVGAWGQASGGGTFAGRVYLYSGLTGALLTTADGLAPGDALGTSVSAAGDVDGDGFADYAAGAPSQNGQTGRIYVFRGGPAPIPPPPLLFEQGGEALADFFGTGLGPGGDMDGDGFGEVSVGAHFHDVGTGDVGKAYAYSGVPPGIDSFGSGCPGSLGAAPRIGVTGIPFVGATFEVHLSRTLPGTFALLLLGASNASLPGGLPLPLNLGFLGMPACNLLVSLDAMLPAATSGPGPGAGRVSFPFAIPPDPLLVGGVAYVQWYIVDPGPAPLPGAMTRALAVTLQ